jgi:molybdenum cofactor biosynthesis enzyme MoaA
MMRADSCGAVATLARCDCTGCQRVRAFVQGHRVVLQERAAEDLRTSLAQMETEVIGHREAVGLWKSRYGTERQHRRALHEHLQVRMPGGNVCSNSPLHCEF